MDSENDTIGNQLDVISMSNSSVYAGGYENCYEELEENGKMKMLQWTTAMLGATLFVLFSKVTLLLNPIMGKPWYTDLMTYLIALAMGTMLCVTVFQLIPESLDLMAEKKYPIKCGDYRAVQKTLNYNHKSVIVNDCDKVCPDANGGKAGGGIEGLEDGFCTLTIGGTQQFIPVVCVLYLCTIIFYDLQKFLQIAFSNENGTHLAELDNPEDMIGETDEDILIQMRKYGNRQQ
ncbi:unnamed protein product, partial [Oikopleura dioica]